MTVTVEGFYFRITYHAKCKALGTKRNRAIGRDAIFLKLDTLDARTAKKYFSTESRHRKSLCKISWRKGGSNVYDHVATREQVRGSHFVYYELHRACDKGCLTDLGCFNGTALGWTASSLGQKDGSLTRFGSVERPKRHLRVQSKFCSHDADSLLTSITYLSSCRIRAFYKAADANIQAYLLQLAE